MARIDKDNLLGFLGALREQLVGHILSAIVDVDEVAIRQLLAEAHAPTIQQCGGKLTSNVGGDVQGSCRRRLGPTRVDRDKLALVVILITTTLVVVRTHALENGAHVLWSNCVAVVQNMLNVYRPMRSICCDRILLKRS